MSIRITGIKKAGGRHFDPHHAIEDLAWVNEETGEKGVSTRLIIYDWILNKNGTAYVKDSRGNKAIVGARENTYGTKYVQTYADRVWTDNLLALPEYS
jgi:Protein of unknown function (DUF3892)